ncbi:hypothetical protein COO60DRAFT_1090588 [Scenedesmus sp. NREL 46B-D3]|nr:hypothetical protein COO60DRAFT_1090588 [Scenedesmus sp. NREL 46B-D3]
MVMSAQPPTVSLILNQLKQEIAEIKASCRLASQPSISNAPSLQCLEREARRARRQYDGLLEQRQKQAAELEHIIATWQQLQAVAAAQEQDAPAQRRVQHLQAQLASSAAQLAEALHTQQSYAGVIQQLQQGHSEFGRQLDQVRVGLAGQQQAITKVKAHLLQAQHARDAANRDLAAAEQALQAGRASKAGQIRQLSLQCQALLQAPRAAGSSIGASVACASTGLGAAAVGAAGDASAGQGGLQRCCGSLGAAEYLQELLGVTGCTDEQGLLLHVQAHAKAAASLQEAATAAAAKLGRQLHVRRCE